MQEHLKKTPVQKGKKYQYVPKVQQYWYMFYFWILHYSSPICYDSLGSKR